MYSFDSLCLPLYPELVAFATKLTNSRARGQDIVQDSMIRALRAWDRWSPPEGSENLAARWARSWLYRIVSGVFRNEFQRDKVIRKATVDHAPLVRDNLYQEDHSTQPGYTEDAVGDDVRDALERIRPEWADVVKLIYLEGMMEHEAAAELGIPVGTARSRHARGKIALARILSPLARSRFGLGRRARVDAKDLVATEELQPDADGVDGVVAEDDCLSLDLGEPLPHALSANAG